VRLLPYGEHAVLAELSGPGEVLALARALRDAVGVVEVVPAARTLLVTFDPVHTNLETVRSALDAADRTPADTASGPVVQIDVRYDGADLQATAAEVGVSVDELVRRHGAGSYTVAFCGFSPGFAYLVGLDPALRVPRLATPRTQVPAGSVAIAGEFTGVYPRSSPGGWRLLGTTAAVLWDPRRPAPALLTAGTVVRFRPT
jgi:5-oxoprolinase (ATP-hydrolysing) subunit B